jgi:hypothetical protein
MGAHGEFAHTEKQSEIMRHILCAADEGAYITLKQLREKLSYKSSKQSVLCSLMVLENRGFLTKAYHGHLSMELKPTAFAYATFRSVPEEV